MSKKTVGTNRLRHVSRVVGIVAVAGSILALSACGGGGASKEELNQARKQAAAHVHKEVRLRKLERELRHIKKGSPGSTTTTTGGSSVPAPAPAPSGPSGSCGGELSVNSVTTCPFAENVMEAYFEEIGSGSGTVTAYSPTTERLYRMYCTSSPHECTGGNNAAVYFP